MPANLSPEFKKAEERYRAATAPEERLVLLEEMLTTIPKHKGTEKMQADLKTRIAKLKKELVSSGKPGGGGRRGDWFHVEKQGAGQVVTVGVPNAGKSALVRALTGLATEVAAYPFTTTIPQAGMMEFEDIQIQLVDSPPVAVDSPAWLYHIMRTTDVLLVLYDLGDDALIENTELLHDLLAKARIALEPTEGVTLKKLVRLGAKCDDPAALDRLAILRELIGDVPLMLVSSEHGTGLEELRRHLFETLDIIRVYTKKPGKPPVMDDPVILKRGSSLMDAAYHLHKEIAQNLTFARLWNSSGLDGQRVDRAHVLLDKDIVEFHV
ncbi:MAG: TGS domain-containing protein [bacterium]